MASEPVDVGDKPEDAKAEPVKRLSMSRRRQRRLLIAVIVAAVALVVIIWGWSSTGGSFIDVADIVNASTSTVPQKYLGRIEVRGVVGEWSGADDSNFQLVDTGDASKWMDVTSASVYPEGFENGKTIVVAGELDANLPLHMTASKITVGCSSKYS